MNQNEQIKAIAELDGWMFSHMGSDQGMAYPLGDDPEGRRRELPNYLTSRDAIVPVIERQAWTIRILVLEHLLERNCSREITPEEAVKVMLKTPAEICKALLRATGKWKVEGLNYEFTLIAGYAKLP